MRLGRYRRQANLNWLRAISRALYRHDAKAFEEAKQRAKDIFRQR